MCSMLNLVSQKYTVIQESKNIWTTEEHDSLKIWTKTNSFSWFNRKIFGGPREWIVKVLNDNPDNYDYIDNRKLILEEETNFFPYEMIHGEKVYHPYMKQRGLSEATVGRYELEVLDNSILIPINNINGKRVGCNLRTLEKNAKYRYEVRINSDDNVLWPMPLLKKVKYNDTVLIFEGCFSAMRFQQVLDDKVKCFSILGSNPKYKLKELLNRLDNVWFILDNDEGGIKFRDRLVQINRHWKFDFPVKYADEMNSKEVIMYAEKLGII